jgi:hypothetical protein
MKNLKEIAAAFGTHDYCIERWVNSLSITNDDIEFALTYFDKRQRFNILCKCLRPTEYLVEHPELISYIYEIDADVIKALPDDIFRKHHSALLLADKVLSERNQKVYPYNDYNAEAFCALRYATKKTDISFIKRMYVRSISHPSYPKARQKLTGLANLKTAPSAL